VVQGGTTQTKGVTASKIIMRAETLPLAELRQPRSLLLVVFLLFFMW